MDNTNDPVGVLISALEKLAAQDSGIVASSAKSDCMAATAKAALRNYKAAAIQHSEQRETVPAVSVLSISWPMPRYRMETGYMQPDERGSWCKWIDVHPNMDSPPVAAPVPEAKAEQAGYPYQALFNSIGAAVEIQGIAKAISVKAFVSALQNEGYQITPAAPAVSPSLHSVKHEASELPPLPKHCIGNGGFNERQMRAYGQACHALGRGDAVRDYCNTGTFNVPPIAVQGSIGDDAEFANSVSEITRSAAIGNPGQLLAAVKKHVAYIDSRSPVAAAPSKVDAAVYLAREIKPWLHCDQRIGPWVPMEKERAESEMEHMKLKANGGHCIVYEFRPMIDAANFVSAIKPEDDYDAALGKAIRALSAAAPSSDTKK